jgi:predicted butyrate kinase (DUF1464 family)
MMQLLKVLAGIFLSIYVFSGGLAYINGVDPIYSEASAYVETATGNTQVVMYSTHSCGYCKKARQYLDR